METHRQELEVAIIKAITKYKKDPDNFSEKHLDGIVDQVIDIVREMNSK